MNFFAQSLAIDELHRDEVRAFVLANLVDVRDVRMIERWGRFRLTNESVHSIAMRGQFGRQNLQCNFAI